MKMLKSFHHLKVLWKQVVLTLPWFVSTILYWWSPLRGECRRINDKRVQRSASAAVVLAGLFITCNTDGGGGSTSTFVHFCPLHIQNLKVDKIKSGQNPDWKLYNTSLSCKALIVYIPRINKKNTFRAENVISAISPCIIVYVGVVSEINSKQCVCWCCSL